MCSEGLEGSRVLEPSALFEKVANGFANLEAQFQARHSSSFGDRSLIECQNLDEVMAKFDDEYKRMMVEEDKQSIIDYESLNTVVRKLDLDVVALKDRVWERRREEGGDRRHGHLPGWN